MIVLKGKLLSSFGSNSSFTILSLFKIIYSMAIDSFLHIFVGGFLTIFLLSCQVKAKYVLLLIAILAFGKELYDHFAVLGHCYPKCLDEHVSDFFFSIIFFAIYIPIIAFIREIKKNPNPEKIHYKHYSIIWITVSLIQFTSFNKFVDHTQHLQLSNQTLCRV